MLAPKRKISALIGLTLALMIVMPTSAFAASKHKVDDPNAIARVTTNFEVGVLDPTSAAARSVGGSAIAATTSCKYAYWIAEARNVLGTVLFQYKEQVDWCFNGTSIVGTPGRTTTPITPVPWVWAFQNETLFDPSGNSSAMTYAARGTFAQYAYPYPWPVAYSYPMVSITVRGNGTASGTISW